MACAFWLANAQLVPAHFVAFPPCRQEKVVLIKQSVCFVPLYMRRQHVGGREKRHANPVT